MQESNATGPKDPKISSDSEEKEQMKDEVSKVQEQLGNHEEDQQEGVGAADFDQECEASTSTVSTASDDNDNGNGDSDSSESEGNENGYVQMPLLKYGRIVGSLPREVRTSTTASPSPSTSTSPSTEKENSSEGRPLSIPCQCSALGRVVIQPTRATDAGVGGLGLTSLTNSTIDISNNHHAGHAGGHTANDLNDVLRSKSQSYSVLAMAMANGTIHLLDAQTGKDICPCQELKVYNTANSYTSTGTGSQKTPDIVALSFDSGANYLAALTADGDVAIFELKYGTGGVGKVPAKSGASSSPPMRREKKLFDTFLSKLSGEIIADVQMTGSNVSDVDAEHEENPSNSAALHLTQPVSTARFTYKTSNDANVKANCLALDPGYNRKREKCILVGFSNGRLVYTKRSGHGGIAADGRGIGGVMGSLLQPKRHDLDIYQSVGGDGIEAVAWRGRLIAWADAR